MADDDEVVTLQVLGSIVEAEMVRTTLTGAGIDAYVFGNSTDPRIAATEGVRVNVRASDLERARALLADAMPMLEPEDGTVPEGALCPVHQQAATALCDRCGTFLCGACKALGDPPLCEDCIAAEANRRPVPGQLSQRLAQSNLLPAVLIGGAFLTAFLWAFFQPGWPW